MVGRISPGGRWATLGCALPDQRRFDLLSDVFERFQRQRIARQSSWQVRVIQDGKGSRGIWIMPLMIVAGKLYVSV